MNRFLKSFLTAAAVIFLLAYLAGSFYEVSFNPLHWEEATRRAVAMLWTFFSTIAAVFILVAQDNSR